MTAPVFLPRLNNVHATGANSWRADCPNGHAMARGSLSITESDNALLVHCFACADTPGILAAVGLSLSDLYPERIKDTSPEGRRAAREAFKRNAWAVALRVLSCEATVVGCAAKVLRQGYGLTDEDDARLTVAMQRIENARAVLA